jgi:hypothetical protein
VELNVGPGINWSGPSAVTFNSNVVDSSDNSEESLFTPVSSPRVSYGPELDSVFNSKSNDRDFVYEADISSSVFINTASVVLKGLRYCNSASNRSSLIDFLDHVFFSGNFTEFFDSINVIGVWYEAWIVRVAVLANSDVRALNSIVMSSGSVDGASLISHFISVHVGECGNSISTVATKIGLTARDQDLGSNINIRPCSLSGDFYSVRED